ncbi:MAG: hypothetical protein HOP29_10285 [Phycisphaerales bacterium]|nr:hypothetical protein [Phycisphaerales bacterium]
MNSSQIVLKLVLDSIGQPVTLDTFDHRFTIQKKIYLTQLTGLDLAYRFGWYLRGPYSRELTRDAFRLNEEMELGERDYEKETLSPFARKRVQQAPQIWANKPDGIDEDDWLELLASLHYLKHIAYMGKDARREFDDVWQALIDSKPRFKGRKDDGRKVWEQLRRVGLLTNKVLPAA